MKPPEGIQDVLPPLPTDDPVPWVLIVFILFGAAIVSWGLTEALKATALNRLKYRQRLSDKEAAKHLWWSPLLIVASIVMGSGIGCVVGGLEWKWLYGGLVGAVGGALASFLVSLFKGNMTALAKKMVGSSPPDAGGTDA